MCTHNQCFRAKTEKCHNFSSENLHFYSREILLYIPWACLRNDMTKSILDSVTKFQYHKLTLTCLIDRPYKGTITFHFHTTPQFERIAQYRVLAQPNLEKSGVLNRHD